MKNGDDENPLKVSMRYQAEVFPEVTGKVLPQRSSRYLLSNLDFHGTVYQSLRWS